MVGGVRKACQTCMYMLYVGNVWWVVSEKHVRHVCICMYVGNVWRWWHSQDAAAAAAAFFIPHH
jgi:hypothetical protein